MINNNASHDDTIQCQVSVDGTWQKRGHSSFNGVVTAISTLTGKCIDAVVLSKRCKGCILWKSKKGTPEYEDWKAYHKRLANHQRSSGAMEGAGAITISIGLSKNISYNILVIWVMVRPHCILQY